MPSDINCISCKKNNTKFIIKENEHDIYNCNNCNLYFVHPLPEYTKGEEIINYWSPDSERNNRINFQTYHQVNMFYLNIIKKKLPEKSKILDLGCGYGHFVNLSKINNYISYGVDLSKDSIEFAKNELNLENIYCEDLLNINFNNEFFDCVIALNLFEHISSPVDILNEVNRILSKNGILIIRIPNIEFHELIYGIYKFMNKKYSILADLPPVHLFGYSQKNLKNLLINQNFTIVNFGPSPLGNMKNNNLIKIFYRNAINYLSTLIFYISFKKINICPSLYIIVKKK